MAKTNKQEITLKLWQYQVLTRMKNTHSGGNALPAGTHNSPATWEGSLAHSNRVKHTLTFGPGNPTRRYLSN